jgi:hypothetical protein
VSGMSQVKPRLCGPRRGSVLQTAPMWLAVLTLLATSNVFSEATASTVNEPKAGAQNAPAVATLPASQPPAMLEVSVATRLAAIDSAVAKLADKASKPDYTPALLSLAGTLGGVVLGGIITILVQRKVLANQLKLAEDAAGNAKLLAGAKGAQDRQLAQERANLEVGAAIVQWRLKQLSELYGPLYALLRQSHDLYRNMNLVLVGATPEKFRLKPDVHGDDFDRQLFEINLKGQWVRFRTVMHLDQVYGCGYGIEDYFDEVVATGARITKVIQDRAGFVRPEQSDLVAVFGKYLAHYCVLERLHRHLKARQAGKPEEPMINVDVSAVFPSEIQKLVDTGFQAIRAELGAWGAKS